MHISWARLASFCHLGFISDPQIVSKFHNETHDPKGQENKIYTIVKGRETFYRRHTVPVTSSSEVKYVLKRVSFGSKDCTKELKLECACFPGQTSCKAVFHCLPYTHPPSYKFLRVIYMSVYLSVFLMWWCEQTIVILQGYMCTYIFFLFI